MSIETERTIIIKNKTIEDVNSFLKENAYREDDTVMLEGPFREPGERASSCRVLEMYTTNEGRRVAKQPLQGTITVRSHADGVHVRFQRDKFYDSELFWQTIDALVHEMKQRGFLVWEHVEPTSAKDDTGIIDDRLDPLDRKIIEVVRQIENEGLRATDERVAKRAPLNPRTHEPRHRVTINKRRCKLRDKGYKV